MSKKNKGYVIDEIVSKYFKDVNERKILTQEDEVNLAKRIQNGDDSAIDELVLSNLKFVVTIAKEYQNQGLALSDLINEGNYGLIKAATKFDYTRGFKFISYAVWWIRQSILQSLNDNSRTVRLPTNVVNRVNKINKEFIKIESNNDIDFIETHKFKENNENDLMLSTINTISIHNKLNDENDEFSNFILSEDESLEESELKHNVKVEINNVLECLTKRERLIIEHYFGLSDEEVLTLEAIGCKFNLTKERIRQIKEKAIRKLRYNSENLQLLIK